MPSVITHEEMHSSPALDPQRLTAHKAMESLHKSRRVVVITGAGISVSGGIPDFRSMHGLYDLAKRQFPGTVMKGK